MFLTRVRQALARRHVRPGRKSPPRFRARLLLEPFESRLVPACTDADTQCYLSQLYRDLLAREIDSLGLTNWTQALNSGFTRQQVALAVMQSLEYRTLVVQGAYSLFLGRTADESGLNTFTTMLGFGRSIEQMYAIILGSPEYSRLGNNFTVSGFLNSLYRDVLNRSIDQSSETAFTLLLATGASRESVAMIVVTSLERANNLVQEYYPQYLGRAVDPTGLATFVTALETGRRQQEVISIIVGSAEYFQRF